MQGIKLKKRWIAVILAVAVAIAFVPFYANNSSALATGLYAFQKGASTTEITGQAGVTLSKGYTLNLYVGNGGIKDATLLVGDDVTSWFNGPKGIAATVTSVSQYVVKVALSGVPEGGSTANITATVPAKYTDNGNIYVSPKSAAKWNVTDFDKIRSLSINLAVPAAGKNPATAATIPNNAPYKVKEIVWYDDQMSEFTRKFVVGETYTAYIIIKANSGWVFSGSYSAATGVNLNATLNGSKMAVAAEVTDDGYRLYEDFDKDGAIARDVLVVKKTYTISSVVDPEQEVAQEKKVEAAKPVILAQAIAKGKTRCRISWRAVKGAASYVVYGSNCKNGKGYEVIACTTERGYSWLNLQTKKHYKCYVVAVDSEGNVLTQSKKLHFITGGYLDLYSNTEYVVPNREEVELAVGTSTTVGAKLINIRGKKAITHVNQLRFKSSNKGVASVDSNGVVKAKGPGVCYIYLISPNGVWSKTRVKCYE